MSFLTQDNALLVADIALAIGAGGLLLEALRTRITGREPRSAGGKKRVLVTGATGAQGGSVVDYLLKDGGFAVRGLTRDASSDKAKKLAAKGVELAQGELTDQASVQKAAKGADYAFLVTQFWEKFSEEDEVNQGKTAIDALISAGVKHIVLSTLPPGKKLANVHVPHLDGKWTIAEYLIQKAKAAHVGYTLVFVPFYAENLLGMGMIRKDDKGQASLALPMGDKKWGLAAVSEIGGPVVAVLKHPERYNKYLIDVFAEQVTLADVAKAYQAVTGEPLTTQAPPPDVYARFGFPGAAELAEMFKVFHWIADARAKSSNPYVQLVDSTHYIAGGGNLSKLSSLKEFFAQTKVK